MISNDTLVQIAAEKGTPVFVYDKAQLETTATKLLDAGLPFGHTIRYAAKANPFPGIIHLFDTMGLHFDASSTYEAKHLLDQGVEGRKISLSGQTLDGPLSDVLSAGVLPTATSLHQIDVLVEAGVAEFGVRVNPGMGSGHNNRTNVGGPASSFGIWHEYVPQILERAGNNKITRLHTHIGSGVDPEVWSAAVELSLGIAERLPDVTVLDIGGGYKVARMPDEQGTDMDSVTKIFAQSLEGFAGRTGRRLHLEIEPGTFLVALAGTLVCKIEDIVDTGLNGYTFLRLNTGMNDILRPSMYGAQHPIEVLSGSNESQDYVVVGHNCETGDILTPAPGDPEGILPRTLKKAAIGDLVSIGAAGAYCASMSAGGYNSFPDAAEVLV